MKKNNRGSKKIDTCVVVRADDHRGDPERMIRRFRKLVKNSGIMEEVRERRYFKSPSLKRREKKREQQRKIQKVNRKREELLNPRDSYKRRRPRS